MAPYSSEGPLRDPALDHSLIPARLSTIFMVVALSGNLEAAFSAWIGGSFFDLTSSYALTFATTIASGLLAIGCMWAGRSQSLVPSPSGRFAQKVKN